MHRCKRGGVDLLAKHFRAYGLDSAAMSGGGHAACCARAYAVAKMERIATEGLDAEERQFILDRMRPLSFDPRAILFDQGEPSDTLVLLTEGRVRLYQTLESGEEFTFGLCIAGAILGLAALVTREPRILSAVALEPVTASVMTRTDFMNCLNMVPRFH